MAKESWAERFDRFRMPFLFVVILTLVGGARFDDFRPIEGQAVALALPVFAAVSGAAPFQDANLTLRRAVFTMALLLVGAAELGIYSSLYGDGVAPSVSTLRFMLGSCALAAVVLQGAAAQRGFRSRLAAWSCLAAVFAAYFPAHVTPKNLFASTLAALMVGLFFGGGSGLFLGELSSKLLRGR